MEKEKNIARQIYRFPRAATVGHASDLLRIALPLLKHEAQPGLLIDLSRLELVDSFGLTFLAACFYSLVTNQIHGFVRRPVREQIHLELHDMGLYESIGIGDRFQPRRLSRDRVDIVHITALQPGFIEGLLDFLETMQSFEAGLRPSIRMSLLELIQNFSEHSRASMGAWVAGQFDSVERRISLCVLDSGVGIPESLRSAPKYANYADHRLVELATQEGITSAPKSSRGLGLSMIRRFAAANRGSLTIVAGSAQVTFHGPGEVLKRKLSISFPGTAAFLSLIPTERGLYVIE